MEHTVEKTYSRTRVKVCGITSMEDAEAAVAFGADALGFIFIEADPRYIAPALARKITKKIPAFVQIVGVFADQDQVEIDEIIEYCRLACVQLNGTESLGYCQTLGKLVPPCKIVKTFSTDDLKSLDSYYKYVSGYRLRATAEGEAGSGDFDWSSCTALRGDVIVSGGLSAENVAAVIQVARPFAVDVCAAVETEIGRKDYGKLKAFIEQVQIADQKV